jgi:putative oxidoreductase
MNIRTRNETAAATQTRRLLGIVRIALGLLFLQHGAEKLWGFANGRVDHNFGTLHGFAGPLEVAGGVLLILGMFTRTTAFILCGEMAVAYFSLWAPRGFWPIANGGEEAVIFCFTFLWLVTAGSGSWSVDSALAGSSGRQGNHLRQMVGSWEGYGRSILRVILAFTFSLHGFRHLFGIFAVSGGRGGVPKALDVLPALFGALEITAALCLLVGLLTRPAALILCAELAAAYVYAALPRGPWPIRNGGNETLLYFFVFAYFAAAGSGSWSVDYFLSKRRRLGRSRFSSESVGTELKESL